MAAQVCSHTVYAGIHTLVALGKLPPEAKETANFLKLVNDIFDALNVRHYNDYPLNQKNQHRLGEFYSCVQKWKVKGKLSKQPCLEGLLQCLTAVNLMANDLLQTKTFKYILTGRLNQDCLENFFSQIRARGGHRFNPSPREFSFAFKALCTNMLLTPVKAANCIQDGDEMLVALGAISQQKTNKRKMNDDVEESLIAKKQKLSLDSFCTDDMPVDSSIKSNITSYIGGYIITKAIKCKECHQRLTDNGLVVSDANLYCHFKAYNHTNVSAFGSLNVPTDSYRIFLERIESIFQSEVENYLCSDNVVKDLIEQVEKDVPMCLLNLCSEHRETNYGKAIVRRYLRCRLFYYLKFTSRNLLTCKKKIEKHRY